MLLLLSLNQLAATVEKILSGMTRFAAIPLQLQLEFAGRFRWLIRQGNQLLTLVR